MFFYFYLVLCSFSALKAQDQLIVENSEIRRSHFVLQYNFLTRGATHSISLEGVYHVKEGFALAANMGAGKSHAIDGFLPVLPDFTESYFSFPHEVSVIGGSDKFRFQFGLGANYVSEFRGINYIVYPFATLRYYKNQTGGFNFLLQFARPFNKYDLRLFYSPVGIGIGCSI